MNELNKEIRDYIKARVGFYTAHKIRKEDKWIKEEMTDIWQRLEVLSDKIEIIIKETR